MSFNEIYIEDAASHEIEEVDILSLSDFRNANFDEEVSFEGKVSAEYVDRSTCEYMDLLLKRDFKDLEVLRVEGTLYLYE